MEEVTWNVWALSKDNNLKYNSGDYRSLVMLETDEDAPDVEIDGFTWICIGFSVTEEEAKSIMNQYPHVPRSEC